MRTPRILPAPGISRRIAYLLLGLPLGTAWFTIVVTGLSVGLSMLVVALVGIPLLLMLWYVVRALANMDRMVANVLLGTQLAPAPMSADAHGNLWVRLRATSREPVRRRELGYLLLRLPVGVATFTIAVAALTVPVAVAYAPFSARFDDDHTYGDWSLSSTLADFTTSSGAWLLVPAGALMLLGSLHLLNALADRCARWTTKWLGTHHHS